MRRALAFALLPALASGCAAGGGGTASTQRASTSASASPAPTALPTPSAVPVFVKAHKSAKRFIEFSETNRANKIVYRGTADSQTAQRDPSGNATSEFVNPRLHFIARDGKVLYAASPAGTVTERAKAVTVLMSGRVHAHTTDGTRLESDTLLYNDATRMVHAAGNVILTTGNERLEGGALDADLRLSHVHLTPGDA